MSLNFKILSGCLFFLIQYKLWAYPQVLSWQNSPIIAYENKKQAVLVKNLEIKMPFAVVTANRDELKLKINSFDTLNLYQKSKAQILDINNETQFVPDFYFLSGKLRYTAGFRGVDKADSVLTLNTPFFELKLNQEVDFFVELNMNEAWVEVKVVKGSLLLEFFAYETKITLNAGEQVRFQGESTEDRQTIKYDYLLDGKKVPRGKVGEVKVFDKVKYLKEEERVRALELKRKKDIEFARLEKIRKQKEYEDSFLCKKPFANKDQCAWWVEKGKCYRKRCNVSGRWGDIIERPVSSKCKSDFIVDTCDY